MGRWAVGEVGLAAPLFLRMLSSITGFFLRCPFSVAASSQGLVRKNGWC